MSGKAEVGFQVSFTGFSLDRIDSGGRTTRQLNGETQKDFQYFPLIRVVPDKDGDITVKWSWNNKFPDDKQAGKGDNIVNTFTDLKAGQAVVLELIDDRDPLIYDRDPSRNGAIAIGDKDFLGLNVIDGLWHNFRSDVTVEVTSPSGEKRSTNGVLSEIFRYVPLTPPPPEATVNLTISKPTVKRGENITFTADILNGQPNLIGITMELKAKLSGTVNWSVSDRTTVNTDANGYTRAVFLYTVSMTYPLGTYDIKATASYGTASLDSNIGTLTVTEESPPPTQANVHVEVWTRVGTQYMLSPGGKVQVYSNGQMLLEKPTPDGYADVTLPVGTYRFVAYDNQNRSNSKTVNITGDTTVQIYCG